MAKDGTNRGGARVGAGRKPKALADKIAQGGTGPVLSFPESADFKGEDVPPVKDFLKASQKSGVELCAEDVFKSTYLWLKERGCDRFINTQLIEQYAMSVSRWVQCETMISEYGFLSKHPTTGQACASPFVAMAQNYQKQVNTIWYQIFQVVRENCSTDFDPDEADPMEMLLRSRG